MSNFKLLLFGVICGFGFLVGVQETEKDPAPDYSLKNGNLYLYLVNLPEVREELVLSSGQQKVLDEEIKKFKMMLIEFTDIPLDSPDREEAKRLFFSRTSEIASSFNSELLAHQKSRLKQLEFQFQLANRYPNLASPYLSDEFAKQIQLSDQQRMKIEAIVKERDSKIKKRYEEFLKDSRELKQESREKVLGLLTNEQSERTDELMGNPADFSGPQPNVFQRKVELKKR